MDFDLPPADDERRRAVRSWLEAHPTPSGRELAQAGYVVPHWPEPYGVSADPVHQLIIDEELKASGVSRPNNPIGIGWAAPTILSAGTEAQKERYLMGALAGEDFWCQLFSEPDAGSDLASLTTWAERRGDGWVVNGAKIWTSGAHLARYAILIARTDPSAAKHRGISYFVCPMDAPGITLAPIVDMTGVHAFNQVFFDDVHLGPDALIGDEGDGWRLAKATLANERVSLSSGGALWGMGPSVGDLIDLVRAAGGTSDPLLRQDLARVWSEGEILRLIRLRSLTARLQGRTPGPEASVQKLLADEHGQHVMAAGQRLAGAGAMVAGAGPAGHLGGPTPVDSASDGASQTVGSRSTKGRGSERVEPIWYFGFLFSPALTIGGGTGAVQRNIVAERVLGLPHDPAAT